VRLGDRDITRLTPRRRTEAGLAHIPEDRHRRGMVLEFSLAENLILGRHRRFGTPLALDRAAIGQRAERLIGEYDVRPPLPAAAAGTLSGGNQQKVVVAREITDGPRLLLAGQPTRGVDIGAVEAIHDQLRGARDRGLGVLLVSADLNELLALSDRIAVMRRGRLVADLPAADATTERLGELMLGAGEDGGSP
jgi:simple sugar transport system ATP-binding protein